jgi:anti-anti-sigma factor
VGAVIDATANDTLALSYTQQGDEAVIAVNGELDATTTHRLRHLLTDLLRQPLARISVDLAGVVFMDSSGLGALLANSATAARIGMEFRVVNPSDRVARVLDLTGTTDRLVAKP